MKTGSKAGSWIDAAPPYTDRYRFVVAWPDRVRDMLRRGLQLTLRESVNGWLRELRRKPSATKVLKGLCEPHVARHTEDRNDKCGDKSR